MSIRSNETTVDLPTMVMLVGLPGSGKSTFAKNERFKDFVIHSSDEVRERLYGDESIQGNNNEVFEVLKRELKENLKEGKSVLYDATNLSYKRRKAFLQELKKYPCIKSCILVATPYENVLQNNKSRKRVVPERVIKNMYTQIDVPGYYEGWDNIEVYYPEERYKTLYDKPEFALIDMFNYDQHNPHHKLSLGDHCLECAKKIKSDDSTMLYAAIIHDFGKPFCMTFTNSKGEISDVAHYYKHEVVGSYNALFYDVDEFIDKLYAALLIRWHMQMYFIEKQPGTMLKYMNLLGEDMYKDLTLLHEADKEAH